MYLEWLGVMIAAIPSTPHKDNCPVSSMTEQSRNLVPNYHNAQHIYSPNWWQPLNMRVVYSQFEYAVLSTPCFTPNYLLETVKQFHSFHTTSCMDKHSTAWILKTQERKFYIKYNSYCKSQRKLIKNLFITSMQIYYIHGEFNKKKTFCELDS